VLQDGSIEDIPFTSSLRMGRERPSCLTTRLPQSPAERAPSSSPRPVGLGLAGRAFWTAVRIDVNPLAGQSAAAARKGAHLNWPVKASLSPSGSFSTISRAISLSFLSAISSFPHGTCSISVSRRYLALGEVYHPFWAAFPNNPTLLKAHF